MANFKKTNPVAVAMRKRYPRHQEMSSRKREKDYKNSWKKECLDELDEESEELKLDYDPDWRGLDPDYLWTLPAE
jgi:hypothetical protein